MRPLQDEAFRVRSKTDYAALKLASKHLVKACGGVESAALITRVGHSELARYYDPAEKLFMPVDIAADLETDCGNPLLSRALANLSGYELVAPPPQASEAEKLHHWSVLLANLGQETAAALAQIAAALSEHGTLSAQTISNHRLTEHLGNLIQAAVQLRAMMTGRKERSAACRNGGKAVGN